MSKISTTIWPIEPHTEAKHAILRKYLDAWLPIITKHNKRVLYIDGFAGPGEYVNGEDGSPIIAIKALSEHTANIKSKIKMLFIEAKRDRFNNLKQKINSLNIPSIADVEPIYGKFDETLADLFKYIDEQRARLAPAFVFIDPFGFTGIPFTLIKRIMKNEKSEVLITFMFEEINRFISDNRLWGSLTNTFGTNEWKKVIPEQNSKKRTEILHSIYKEQLERDAGIKFVRSFKMINRVNKTDYFLFFCTNHITGLTKMKEAMWRVDKSGLFQFSDATYSPNQPVLFEMKPNYNQLKNILLENFKGKSISISDLQDFILKETPFRETHYKKAILRPMERTKPAEIKVRCKGKRRKGTFPLHCIVKFL